MSDLKTTTIASDDTDVHVQCPHCDNCESHPIDEQRHHIQTFDIEWPFPDDNNPEVSIMTCHVCKGKFNLVWDYSIR